ncbi:MAG: hypothetical protein PWQ45_139 [Thermosipho sp. (in: thermotogales)]|nr:hypothetical protein [Thermosipho sp. (in: thermotogales)]
MKNMSIYIPDKYNKLMAKLQEKADKKGVSLSRIMLELLDEAIKKDSE